RPEDSSRCSIRATAREPAEGSRGGGKQGREPRRASREVVARFCGLFGLGGGVEWLSGRAASPGNAFEGVAQLVEHVTFKRSKGKKTTDFPWFLHFPLHQLPHETPVCGCSRV